MKIKRKVKRDGVVSEEWVDGILESDLTILVVAGSRGITDSEVVYGELDNLVDSGLDFDVVVSGGADGVDSLGEQWGVENGYIVYVFIPEWDDTSHPDAVVRERRDGSTYDASAGVRRNQAMVDKGDYVLVIWDGESSGSEDTISRSVAAENVTAMVRVVSEEDDKQKQLDSF